MATPGKTDFSRIEHDLLRKAGDYKALHARLLKPSGVDPELDRLRTEAARLLVEGRLAEVDRILAQAEQRNLDGTIALDKMSKERLLAAAAGRADRAAAAILQLNPKAYGEAAERFAEAALIAASADAESGRGYAWMQADALARKGADFSDRSAFVAAIEQLRGMLAKLDNFDETVPWAETQLRLARSLTGLSHYEGGGALLRQVVEIYRTTLEDLTRAKAPRLWATLQTRLGEALARLGEMEDDAGLLEEGVSAFRAGLSGLTRSDMPREWGRLQWEARQGACRARLACQRRSRVRSRRELLQAGARGPSPRERSARLGRGAGSDRRRAGRPRNLLSRAGRIGGGDRRFRCGAGGQAPRDRARALGTECGQPG